MLRMLSAALNTITVLTNKVRSVQAFDEAVAYYNNKQYGKAFPMMEEAAKSGNARAMSMLGSMYALGYGVKENGNQAVKWLVKATENGDQEAVSVLGMVYVTGKGGAPRRMEEGIALLEKAAATGDEQSVRMLSAIRNREGIFRKLR